MPRKTHKKRQNNKTNKDTASRRVFKGTTYRSIYEAVVAENMFNNRAKFEFEPDRIYYTKPATTHYYTPDFKIKTKKGKVFYVETKGYLDATNRKNMLLVRESNPELDVRFLFQSDNPIRKGSKTYYSDWAKSNGFLYSIGYSVPLEWLEE